MVPNLWCAFRLVVVILFHFLQIHAYTNVGMENKLVVRLSLKLSEKISSGN